MTIDLFCNSHLTILPASHGACASNGNRKPIYQAEMVEANEFYDLAKRYNVISVPQTIINDGFGVVFGAVPEEYLPQEIKRAI
jgi:protein-disulfide isomerase